MDTIRKFKVKKLNRYDAVRLIKEFNGIKSFSGKIMRGGSNQTSSYRDEDFKLKVIECINCREDSVLV